MIRFAMFFMVAFSAFGVHPALQAAPADLEVALSEMSIGSKDAPVTMYEYLSLTCPHCVVFHRDTLPRIKEAYIDTGKLRLVYFDFPLDDLALASSMLARCVGPAMYPGMIEIMFRSQATWLRSDNPLEDLENIGRFAGLTRDETAACVTNRELALEIKRRQRTATEKLGIRSTPAFRIGDRNIVGSSHFETFRRIIEEELKKAK